MDELISKQAGIDSARQGICDFFGLNADDFKFPITNTDCLAWALNKNITARINSLPSAEPQRKKGKWIPVTNGRGGHECSVCHLYAPSFKSGEENLSPYCPNCGAKMREKEKEYESE